MAHPSITIDGQAYTLCANYETFCIMERETGLSVSLLALKLAESALPLEQMARMLQISVNGAIPVGRIGAAMAEGKFSDFASALATMFSNVFESHNPVAIDWTELDALQRSFPDY